MTAEQNDGSFAKKDISSVTNHELEEGFFSSEGLRLKYSLVLPESLHEPAHPALLFVHGASSAAGRGRVLFAELQQALASAGIASFAYDTRGVGESEGEFQGSTLIKRAVDATNAHDFLASHRAIDEKRLAALGLSMGGHVVARVVGENPVRYGALVLVNPAAYGADTEDRLLKPSEEFIQAIRRPRNWEDSLAFSDIRHFAGLVLLATSAVDDVVTKEVLESYQEAIPYIDQHVTLPVEKHAFFSGTDEASTAARRILSEHVTAFLAHRL